MGVIDLRSDTVTLPSAEMREAMRAAEVGDDVMREDPTVTELEREVSQLLGKEAGLFVPSGTMANLIAQLVHCSERQSEALCGSHGHTVLFEGGGASSLGGVHVLQVPTHADGTLDLDSAHAMVRNPADVHHPVTKLLILENTHNFRGGRVLPLAFLDRARGFCDQHGLKLHCDGARLWHAAVALDVPVARIAEPFDSLSVCLSKGLAAPVGSVLVGTAAFIGQARRVRKMVGGGMRQAGVIAAAGLVAVRVMRDRLHEDHATAQRFASGVRRLGLQVTHEVETNIVFFDVAPLPKAEFVAACKAEGVLFTTGIQPTVVRCVTHFGIAEADVDNALAVVEKVLLRQPRAQPQQQPQQQP